VIAIQYIRPILLLITLLLHACTQTPAQPSGPVIPQVGTIALARSVNTPDENRLLDVGVLVFENEADEQDSQIFGEWVFSEIRENETHYLPFVLRNTLIDSNQWGSIRVLPQDDPSVDLLISGTVLHSDGIELALHIVVRDSTGRQWLEKDYADSTLEDDFPETTRFTPGNRFDATNFVDPFQDIYNQIHNDLVTARAALTEQELIDIGRVSQIVYASDLSPESFNSMLEEDDEGRLTVSSLPSENDPMIVRVEEMRLRHHLFIDTVDEYYQALFEDMQPSYVIWRRYSFDQIQETERSAQRTYDATRYSSSRGYLTLTQRYDRFRWSKIYEQEFRELASGFNREIAPSILELNKQVHGLSGTMEEQYIQWRRILRQLFALESG
jgi:hypothetical protein